jgi:T-complex protein 1 subunit gamma
MLQLEEESIRAMCQDIIAVKPDVIVTEKGISGKLKTVRICWFLKDIIGF